MKIFTQRDHFTNIKWGVGKERWIRWGQGESTGAGRELNNQFRCLCQPSLPAVPMLLMIKKTNVPADPLEKAVSFDWLKSSGPATQHRSSSRLRHRRCGLGIPPSWAFTRFSIWKTRFQIAEEVTWWFAVKFWHCLIPRCNFRSEEGRRAGAWQPIAQPLCFGWKTSPKAGRH